VLLYRRRTIRPSSAQYCYRGKQAQPTKEPETSTYVTAVEQSCVFCPCAARHTTACTSNNRTVCFCEILMQFLRVVKPTGLWINGVLEHVSWLHFDALACSGEISYWCRIRDVLEKNRIQSWCIVDISWVPRYQCWMKSAHTSLPDILSMTVSFFSLLLSLFSAVMPSLAVLTVGLDNSIGTALDWRSKGLHSPVQPRVRTNPKVSLWASYLLTPLKLRPYGRIDMCIIIIITTVKPLQLTRPHISQHHFHSSLQRPPRIHFCSWISLLEPRYGNLQDQGWVWAADGPAWAALQNCWFSSVIMMMEDKTQRNWRPQRDLDWKKTSVYLPAGIKFSGRRKWEFCTKECDALHACCRASIPNVIVDGQDDSEEEEEEKEETAAATEQFSTDMAYVLSVKQPSEESSDTSDYG